MLFKRKTPASLGERIWLLFWPRRSWARSIRYILLRLNRLPSSPHKIAVGAAAGVFAIVTPFLGAQILIAAILAWLMRGSIVASFLASFAGNPITYPIIWFATYNLGNVLLGGTATMRLVDLQSKASAVWDSLVLLQPEAIIRASEGLWPLLKPMLIGSLPLGAFLGAATYVGVRRVIAGVQAKKRERVQLRAAPQTGS